MQQNSGPSSFSNVWVMLAQEETAFNEAAIEILGLAHSMARKLGEKVCVLSIGDNVDKLEENLPKCGADRIVMFDGLALDDFSPDQLAESIAVYLSEQNARIFICSASSFSNDLFARVAVKLKTGLVKNCVGLELNEQKLLTQIKPVYGGKVYSNVVCPSSRPQMATIRPGKLGGNQVFQPSNTEVIRISPQISSEMRVITERIFKADPDAIDIDEADIIVAGGGGMGSAANFELLKELAERLGGTVAASLVPVDKGWINKNKTVGQTGKTVTPKLYIACGISGEHHHVLGMKDSENIIAINSDAHAPIFKIADIGAVGDVLAIVPDLIGKLRDFSTTEN